MIAKNLINLSIPPLRPHDKGEKALKWMGELHVNHLPIVEDRSYMGIISEFELLDSDNPSDMLSNLALEESKVFIKEYEHIFDVIKIMNLNKLSILPVLDEEDQYLGAISWENLIEFFATTSAFQNPGAILILEMNNIDYSMSEIARIVESNDATILSSYVTTPVDAKLMEVTIKISRTEIDNIVASFERYEYNIKAAYRETESDEFLKDRLDAFLKYLSI